MSSDGELRQTILQANLEDLEILERFYSDAADSSVFADVLATLRAKIAALREELCGLDDRGS